MKIQSSNCSELCDTSILWNFARWPTKKVFSLEIRSEKVNLPQYYFDSNCCNKECWWFRNLTEPPLGKSIYTDTDFDMPIGWFTTNPKIHIIFSHGFPPGENSRRRFEEVVTWGHDLSFSFSLWKWKGWHDANYDLNFWQTDFGSVLDRFLGLQVDRWHENCWPL